MYSLCLYLNLHQDELYPHDTHYINRSETFFSKSPFDNVLMWKNRIETCLNNKNPNTIPIVKDESSIKRHFRVVRAKRKRGRTKKKQKQKNVNEKRKSEKSASPKNGKKARIQSSMNTFITQEKHEVNEETNEEENENQTLPKIQVSEANSGLRRSIRNKKKSE